MPPWEKYAAEGAGPWQKYDPEYGVLDYAQGGVGGFNVGLTKLVGAPVDLVTAGLNLIPGLDIQEPVGGSASIRGALPEEMFPEPPPTVTGRIVARVGEELGASALPAAGILRAARGVPQVVDAGAKLLPRVKSAFLDPIRRAPGRATVGETVAATGAGVGAGIAQEVAPGSATAEVYAQIFGGFTPAVLAQMPLAVAHRLLQGLIKRFSAQEAARQGARAVQSTLETELTSEAERLLREAEVLRAEIPGFNPSLGEATGSPALIATQRGVERSATGVDLERVAARRAGSEAAVEKYATTQAPASTEGPDFVIDTANRQIEDLRGLAEAESAALAGQRRELAGGLPRAEKAAAGEAIRNNLLKARDAARTRMNQLADRLGINNEDVSVPFQSWRTDVLNEVRPESAYGDTIGFAAVKRAVSRKRPKKKKKAVPVILDQSGRPIRPEVEPEITTFQDVKAVRERLSDAVIDEIGSANPSRKKIRALVIAKGRMDNFMEGLAESDVSGRYKEFRKAYFDEYIKPFEEGTVYKVRQRDGRGFYKTADEKVAEAFWRPGDIRAARQFKAVLAADPKANSALEAVALDSLRDTAVRDGVIQPNLLETWTRRHASLLDEFPDIRKAVDDVTKADSALIGRQGELSTRRQFIEDQLLTRELNAFSKATKTGTQVIDAALRDPRKMRQLVATVRGKPEALAALQRHVWDKALAGGADDLMGFLGGNAKSLSRLFSKAHLKNLAMVGVARSMHGRVPAPAGAAYAPRVFGDVERAIGQGIPQIGSRIFAFKSGRMQKGYLVLDTLMRGLRGRVQASAEDLFRVALYDPAVAREMASAVTMGKVSTKAAKRLQARWFALVPTLVEEDAPPSGQASNRKRTKWKAAILSPR